MKLFYQWRHWMIWFGLVIIGSSAGYIYYAEVGCEIGTCPISSDPVNAMLWGGMMGAVAGFPGLEKWYYSYFKKEQK